MLVIAFLLLFCFGKAQTTKEILNEDYKSYLGREVSSFLEHKYIKNYTDTNLYAGSTPCVLQGCHFNLTDTVYVKVIVYEFLFIKKVFDTEMEWDFELFKKEKISQITFLSEIDSKVLLDIKEEEEEEEERKQPDRSYTIEDILEEIED